MSIIGPDGKPVQSSAVSEEFGYKPENMMVVASLVNKVTEKPELTFQIMIPFEQFQFYMDKPELFTLTINNFVGYAYGLKVLEEEVKSESDIVRWTQEAADKYSVSLSEPLATDAIFQDSSSPDDFSSYDRPQEDDSTDEKDMVN